MLNDENKRFLLSFKNISGAMIVILLMTVSFFGGQMVQMRVAVEKGKAVINKEGNFRWKR